MKNSFDPSLLNELIDQSHNPPGNDPILGKFYTSLVEMIEKNHLISKILMQIKKQRSQITNKHMVNLIFRAYQAIKFEQNDLTYKDFNATNMWEIELKKLLSDQKSRNEFENLLKTKSTTTTIYQRYAGPYAIISHFWNEEKVSIADLGCGGNYGLRGMEIGEPFKAIKDLTPKKTLLKLLSRKINIKKGLAIDKENPDNPRVRRWRLACSFYPKELAHINKVKSFEERIKASKKTTFFQANLLSLEPLPKKSVDLVILSTILYQLTLEEQLIVMEKAKKIIKPNGLLIVQDFAAKSIINPKHLDFSDSWFGKSFSYRTFIAGVTTQWKFLEIFQWNSGRCSIVKPGADFKLVFADTQPKISKPAFAHSAS